MTIDFPEPGDQNLLEGIHAMNNGDHKNALKHFEKSSSYDNEYGMVFVAIFNLTGLGLEKRDPPKALTYLKKANLECQTVVAQYLIGIIYLQGDEGVEQNSDISSEFLLLAGINGWGWAVPNVSLEFFNAKCLITDYLGIKDAPKKDFKKEPNITKSNEELYLFGTKDFKMDISNISKDITASIEESTAERMISPVCCARAFTGEDIDQCKVTQANFWNLLTNRKSNKVQDLYSSLGIMYLFGGDFIHDKKKALSWFEKAGNHGDAGACSIVGSFYEVMKNYKEALIWYIKAKELGDIYVLFNIFRFYQNGLGVEVNYKISLENIEAFNKHTEDGLSFFHIGMIYLYGGHGVKRDSKKALDILLKAFDKGCIVVATVIGGIYLHGIGIKSDKDKAFQWFTKGDSINCSEAQFELGKMHETGYKGKVDMDKAYDFYIKSMGGGNEEASFKIGQYLLSNSMRDMRIKNPKKKKK